MNIKLLILILGAACALSLLVLPWTFDDDPATVSTIAKLNGQWVGRQAPDFELVDLQGNTHRLKDYRGKVIFLNFWASYCAPCRKEMPSMERLVRKYKSKGMVMIAISFDKEPQEVQTFMNTFLAQADASAMTLLLDPSKQSGFDYGTELIPETYIIDQQGRIVARFVNAYDWTRPEVTTLIERLVRDQNESLL